MVDLIVKNVSADLEIRLNHSAQKKHLSPEEAVKDILNSHLPNIHSKRKSLDKGKSILLKTANHTHTKSTDLKHEIYGDQSKIVT